MISFLQFFLEHFDASPLDRVPRKAMDVETDVRNIPDECPYGFWVDRSGNFAEVGFQKHATASYDILEAANKWLALREMKTVPVNSHETLLRNGWMRVVTWYKPEMFAEFRNDRPTQSQSKFLRFVKELYGFETITINP